MRLTASLVRPPSPACDMKPFEQHIEHAWLGSIFSSPPIKRRRRRRAPVRWCPTPGFEEAELACDPYAQRFDPVRIAVEVHSTILPRQPAPACVRLRPRPHRIENRKHDRLAVTRNIGERAGARAELRDALVLFSVDIKADDSEACGDQAAGIDLAMRPRPMTPTGALLDMPYSSVRH